MKKAIFIFIAFLFCFQLTGNAQKARVGLTGGLSFANLSRTIGGIGEDGDYRIGIAGGMLVDLPFGKKQQWSFQPSVDYVQKGAAEVATAPVNKKYTALRYAEMPLNFVRNFKCGKSKQSTFYLGAGPYIAFNLPSKKVEHIPGNDVETDVMFGETVAHDMKGVDFGANAIMGYRTGMGIFVSLHYTQGARNLYPVDGTDNKIKNICFGVRIGYLFKNAAAAKK
ncbi:MAG: PorT family protein [Chitinophagaceae bacterium]|nr:PorT family protein [Chitinophagaceae bacterium]